MRIFYSLVFGHPVVGGGGAVLDGEGVEEAGAAAALDAYPEGEVVLLAFLDGEVADFFGCLVGDADFEGASSCHGGLRCGLSVGSIVSASMPDGAFGVKRERRRRGRGPGVR